MNAREQAAYDAAHNIEDDGPCCPYNGVPCAVCPRDCTHDVTLEERKAAAEERSVSGEAA